MVGKVSGRDGIVTVSPPEVVDAPEAQRWNFLRDKTATATVTVKGKRVTVRRDFKGENVEEKMALAGKLGYVPRTA